MKTIIAGSRCFTDLDVVKKAIKLSGFKITEVVSGTCRGVDQLGEIWAATNNIPIKRFPADWKKHGIKAGPWRNMAMAEYANALIAIWDKKSPGTRSMIKEAKEWELQIFVYNPLQHTNQAEVSVPNKVSESAVDIQALLS